MRRLATRVALLLLSLACASPAAAQSLAPTTSVHPGAYRAGSAAAAFGPATAFGDFDADGRPDFAIADRVTGLSTLDYVVEVRLSSGTPQIFTFASSQRALAVTAVDIDHDHDLDLVFTPVVGRRIVGVWLNDGAGHFQRDESGVGSEELEHVVPLTMARASAGDLPAALSPRNVPGEIADRFASDVVDPASPALGVGHSSSVDSSRLHSPRGPPAFI